MPYWQSAAKRKRKSTTETTTTSTAQRTETLTSELPIVLGRDLQPTSERAGGKERANKIYLVSQGHVVGSLFGGEKDVDVERPLEVTVLPAAIVEPYRTSVECGDRSRCGSSAGRDVELYAAERTEYQKGNGAESEGGVPGCYRDQVLSHVQRRSRWFVD